MGVRPLVMLFRHFFSQVRSPSISPEAGAAPQHRTVGRVFFKQRGAGFLPLARKDKWDNWERQWLYMEVDNASPCLHLSQGLPVSHTR